MAHSSRFDGSITTARRLRGALAVAAAIAIAGCGSGHGHPDPGFALVSPVGGETVVQGGLLVIEWTTGDYDGPVAIDLSIDGGATWQPFVLMTPNDGDEGVTMPPWAAGVLTRIQVSQADLDVTVATEPASSSPGDFTVLPALDVQPAAVSGLVGGGSPAFGDYDGDGRLDLALGSRVFHNEGKAGFDLATTSASAGEPAWADYDGDGDLDLTIGTDLYRFDGGATFVPVVTGFPGGLHVEWSDYDDDGDPDAAILGRVFRNDGGTFVEVPTIVYPYPVSRCAWADFDGDGDPDLSVAGGESVNLGNCDEDVFSFQALLRNDGLDVFTEVTSSIQLDGYIAWADVDGDGRDDIGMSGAPTHEPSCTEAPLDECGQPIIEPVSVQAPVFLSGGDGTFLQIPQNFDIQPFARMAWGDFDGDGDPDLAIAGPDAFGQPTVRLYRNDDGTFEDTQAVLPQLQSPELAWGDVDGDGDPDLLLATSNDTRLLINPR